MLIRVFLLIYLIEYNLFQLGDKTHTLQTTLFHAASQLRRHVFHVDGAYNTFENYIRYFIIFNHLQRKMNETFLSWPCN